MGGRISPEPEAAPPPRPWAGWRVMLVVWLAAFGGLVLYELWDFFRGILRSVW